MEEYKEILGDILNYLDLLKNEYKHYKKEQKNFKGLNEDIEHIIELGDLDAIQLMLLVSESRQLLRERRIAIDNYQVLREINNIIDDEFISKVEELYKNINYLINKKNDRKYGARSKIGQPLIDKYSKGNDDLVVSVNDDQLEDLKEQLEMANVS